ncbi:MAG: hypothetical protein J6W82_07290 [Bacteroidales bacterium]|nr:hypothetical protein [Bacteroidales bacterium]
MNNHYPLLSLFALLGLCSCGAPTGVEAELGRIEGYIQEEPRRALEELSVMNRDSLSGARERGQYSLLLSMALDKNYIDLKSDSLILPAAEYYSRHGDNYHRFLARYYQGRVYENATDYEKALKCFIEAESVLDGSVAGEYEVRLYCAKQRVYQHQFAHEEAAREILKAKGVSRNLDSPEFYYRNSLDLAAHYVKMGDLSSAEAELDSLRSWMDGKVLRRRSDYYRSRLRTMMPSGLAPKDSVRLWLEEYLALCSSENTPYDHLLAADASLALDNLTLAGKEFQQCPEPEEDYDKILYFSTWSELYRRLGDVDKALEGRYQYERAVERISLGVFNNDVRFLEERYRDEAERRRSANTIMWLGLAILMLVVAGIYGTAKALRNRRRYLETLQNVKKEYSLMEALVSKGQSPENVKDVLQKRIQALRPYITKRSIVPVKPGRKGLEKLDEDRKNMLRSIGMLYALTYPGFVYELTRYSLEAEEIGMCALYLCGYSSKELSDLLVRGDIYHLNSGIRAKIGEPVGSTKLHVWLRTVFEHSQHQ